MDSGVGEILQYWPGAWRYPRLCVLLSRPAGMVEDDAALRHLLEGLSIPSTAPEVWRDLLMSGEFAAAERLLKVADFVAQVGRARASLRDDLEEIRNKRAEQLREPSWLLQRRASAIGRQDLTGSVEGVLQEGYNSIPLALQTLHRAEQDVKSAEDETFRQSTSETLPRPKTWPFTETPIRTILEWFRGGLGAPSEFRAWKRPEGDLGALHLIEALWLVWESKASIDRDGAERVVHALVQFLGCGLPDFEVHEEPWCFRTSLREMVPVWLPSFLWQPGQRLDVFVAHGAPPSDLELVAQGPSLLVDPFEAVGQTPRGLIELPVVLLLQLVRETVEARAQMLLSNWGRQIEAQRILPQELAAPGTGLSPWPEADLARSFFGPGRSGEKLTAASTRRFLHRFFHYHGIRCEREADLERIGFFAAFHPPLVLRQVRLLLERTTRRNLSRPLIISLNVIEEVRDSADWRQSVRDVFLKPLGDDPVAQAVLQYFLLELQMQGRLESIEGSIHASAFDIAEFVEVSPSDSALAASLDALQRLELIAKGGDDPPGFAMRIATAAVLLHATN